MLYRTELKSFTRLELGYETESISRFILSLNKNRSKKLIPYGHCTDNAGSISSLNCNIRSLCEVAQLISLL